MRKGRAKCPFVCRDRRARGREAGLPAQESALADLIAAAELELRHDRQP
jgi:hypothetical protein